MLALIEIKETDKIKIDIFTCVKSYSKLEQFYGKTHAAQQLKTYGHFYPVNLFFLATLFLPSVTLLSFGHTQPIADPKLIFSIRITKPP